MDGPDRVRTRQAVDLNSLVTQYARTDMRKFKFGMRVVVPKQETNSPNNRTAKLDEQE
jgi:hypothetical protein